MGEREEEDALELLIEWAVTNGAFTRNKLGVRKKVLAGALAHSGVSYREAARSLGGLSYIAVRDCRIKLERLLPPPIAQGRRRVALNETSLTPAGVGGYLWLARDADSGETLDFRFSPAGSPEDSASFCNSVLERCTEKPVMMSGGSGRPRALKNLGFYFREEGGSGVVRMIQRIIRAVSG